MMFTYAICSIFFFVIVWSSCVATTQGSGAVLGGVQEEYDTKHDDTMDYTVPVFTVQELQDGRRTMELQHILGTTGLLSIVGSNQDMSVFRKTRHDAMTGLCTCMKSATPNLGPFASVQGLDSSMLSDQTTRITLATATVGDTPLPIDRTSLVDDAGCTTNTVQALEDLRDYVAFTSKTFITSLDMVLTTNRKTPEFILQTNRGENFNSLSSIVKASQNLEHFHVYSKPEDSSTTFDLDFHTDAGLFLTFVPGMACDVEATTVQPSNDFYLQRDGITYRALFEENSIAIMLGVGAEHWLKTTSTTLKATRHAIAISPGQSRAWYGMSKCTK
jgi:hypothetical protein